MIRFTDPWLEAHYQLGRQLNQQAARRVPPFTGWAPGWEARRAALIATLSPEEQERTRRVDAQLDARRRRYGPLQIARWN